MLEDNRRKKLKLLKRFKGQPEGSVDLSKVRASLERYKIKDNEEFVDDLIDILEEEKHQDAINKFGSTPFIVRKGNILASKKYIIKNIIKNKIPIPIFFIFLSFLFVIIDFLLLKHY